MQDPAVPHDGIVPTVAFRFAGAMVIAYMNAPRLDSGLGFATWEVTGRPVTVQGSFRLGDGWGRAVAVYRRLQIVLNEDSVISARPCRYPNLDLQMRAPSTEAPARYVAAELTADAIPRATIVRAVAVYAHQNRATEPPPDCR